MTNITESEIEQLAIELFKHQGYEYLYAPASRQTAPPREKTLL